MNLSESYKKRLQELSGIAPGKYEVFYHQTDEKSAKKILKNGFNTPEVWAAPDDEGSYGDVAITIYAPKPKKPFIMDIYQLLEMINDKKISYEKAEEIVKKNRKFYIDLGGEINPETFNKLRELGYDVVIEDNGDRAFLYPETLKYELEKKISESYKKRLQELASIKKLPQEETQRFKEIVETIIKRVPALKQYEKFYKEHQDSLGSKFQKQKCYGEKIIATKDRMVHFKDYCIFSELIIYYRHFNDFKWYYFTFKNELQPRLNEKIETNKIFNRVFMMATKMINDKFVLSKEIRLPEEEEISQQEIDSIVEEINKTTFDFEDYLIKYLKFEFFE